jgi:hypothetical protein
MKPWPLVILSLLLRFVVIPIVVWVVLSTVAQITSHPIIVVNSFSVIVINLIVFQFEEDSRRIKALEEDIQAMRRKSLASGA